MGPFGILLLILTVVAVVVSDQHYQRENGADEMVPRFIEELPNHLEFSNTTGMKVECKAEGNPKPIISWLMADGSPVTQVQALRSVNDGVLSFAPFKAEDFRQDVHAVAYQCSASNSLGTILSREMKVKAVITQPYDIYLYDTYVIKGNAAILKCHVPAFLEKFVQTVSWLRDSRYVINSSSINEENKYIMLPSGDLFIRDTDSNDQGSGYKCKALNRLENTTKLSISEGKLYITEPQTNVPPRFSQMKREIIVAAGEDVVIPCIASGYPVPRIKWMKKVSSGQLASVRGSVISGILTLSSVTENDSGIYVCEASNDLDNKHMEVNVLVEVPIRVTIVPKVATADAGGSVTMTCNISGSPRPTLEWFHNGKLMNSNDGYEMDHHSLTIYSVKASHKGIYQCVGRNNKMMNYDSLELKLGDTPPEMISTFQEKTLNPGATLSITCMATGNPTPHFTWWLENLKFTNFRTVTADNGTIMSSVDIRSVQSKDGGFYTCSAVNKAGTAIYSARMNIYGPLTSRQNVKVSAVAGEHIQLICPVYGYPLDKVIWKKGDMTLPFSNQQRVFENNTLFLKNVQKSFDSGHYNCDVRNKKGEKASGIVELSIKVPAKIIPFSFQEDLLREGMRARVQCVISEGDLPLTIQWTKNGQELNSASELGIGIRHLDEFSSILTIAAVTPRHNGNYTCIAKNDAATTSHTAILSVNVAPKITPFRFQEDSSMEGAIARVTCLIYQGDLPVTIEWLKNGQKLHSDHGISVRVIDDYSSILTIENVQVSHTGNYTCVARNRAATVRHTSELLVHVPPKIVPFAFQDEHLLEGTLVRISCVVSRGDLPLSITWLKDNGMLPSNLSVSVRDFDDYSSVFSIDPVTLAHNGNYTCVAKNHAGIAKHTATLTVHVPPRWINPPKDQTVVKGKSLIIDCEAFGYPQPMITWKKALGQRIDDDQILLTSNYNTKIFSNGSLYISQITDDTEGYYLCYASNGIGLPVSRAALIEVLSPVYFKENGKVITAKVGGNATIPCQAFGDIPISFQWEKDALAIQTNSRMQVTFTKENENASITSKLFIMNVSSSDGGTYHCYGSNRHGNGSTTIKLVIKQSPLPPEKVSLVNSGNRSLEISWTSANDRNSLITKYILQYKRKQDSWSSRGQTLYFQPSTSSTRIRDLLPANIYEFRIAAENDVGISNFSDILTIIIDEEAPEGPPLQVEAESVDPQTVRLSWKPPKKNLWNGIIRGYYIGYKVHGSANPYTFTNIEVPEDYTDDLMYQLTDLQMHTEYSIIIQAYNTGGRGPSSEEVFVMTSEDTPSQPPQNIRCSSLSSRSVYVVWDPPPIEAIHGILRGYKVFYKAESEFKDFGVTLFNITSVPKITLTNLHIDTNYSIHVAAFTKLGDGVTSVAVNCKTYEDVPGSPSGVKAFAVSDDSVLVAWKSPQNPNGALTKYNLYYTPIEDGEEHKDFTNKESQSISMHTVDSGTKYMEVKGLKKNSRYAFWLSALSSIGEGPISTVVTEIPRMVEGPAKVASFDDSVQSHWKHDIVLPCKAVGIPTPDRRWMRNGNAVKENERFQVRFDGTLIIKQSLRKDNGRYVCEVNNKYGTDAVEYSVNVLVPPGMPVLEVLSKTMSSIRLRWRPGDDGGDLIQGYKLHYKGQNGHWYDRDFPSDVNTFTLDNLACGSSYQIYLEGLNSVGTGLPSQTISVTTHGDASQIPSKEQLVREGASYITVNLDAWPAGGCPVQHYIIEYRPLSATDWILVSKTIRPSQKKLVVSNLHPGTWYVLRVTAYTSEEDFNIGEYMFGTLTLSGGTLIPEIVHGEEKVVLFYLDPWIFIPIVVFIIICIIVSLTIFIYCKRRPQRGANIDWSQYTGTLAHARQMGVSVESFVVPGKNRPVDANTIARRAMLIRNGNGEQNHPYATIRLSEHRPGMIRHHAEAMHISPQVQQMVEMSNQGEGWVAPAVGTIKHSTNPFLNNTQQNPWAESIYGTESVASKVYDTRAAVVNKGVGLVPTNETTFTFPACAEAQYGERRVTDERSMIQPQA